MIEKEPKVKYFYGTGRRKTSVARVRVFPGSGNIMLNSKKVELSKTTLMPLSLVSKLESIDLSIVTSGGGKTGQEIAMRHGISRALVVMNPEYRPTLKKAGFLTRDPREVERKKPGLKKARRAPQWSKR
ncbi:MAG: SSU ribosomal protein S9P [Candidatus Berkelbacteria bacterium Athens1014_28]|uniref:Small ribosomal subunit protein uS9 n=1 Tax=Candidatus Berkelbacteria bacterium Athens1014_28 TaxID=2017145 RepID=A0A554LR03_9BACT|nr:MAG: SSU ribosomal protein S9P [Candidatus Berkelbacteria bacterium Athens1014_28]